MRKFWFAKLFGLVSVFLSNLFLVKFSKMADSKGIVVAQNGHQQQSPKHTTNISVFKILGLAILGLAFIKSKTVCQTITCWTYSTE